MVLSATLPVSSLEVWFSGSCILYVTVCMAGKLRDPTGAKTGEDSKNWGCRHRSLECVRSVLNVDRFVEQLVSDGHQKMSNTRRAMTVLAGWVRASLQLLCATVSVTGKRGEEGGAFFKCAWYGK